VAITDETAIEQLIAALSAKHGFVPQSHQLEIRGICPACQQS
jgi:Fe2+ or Zn2+ uptake regulation protein